MHYARSLGSPVVGLHVAVDYLEQLTTRQTAVALDTTDASIMTSNTGIYVDGPRVPSLVPSADTTDVPVLLSVGKEKCAEQRSDGGLFPEAVAHVSHAFVTRRAESEDAGGQGGGRPGSLQQHGGVEWCVVRSSWCPIISKDPPTSARESES
eukprot:scaffold126370_cov86-Attheya_sp.AAC.1